jgi:hypothetical protein|tara:strand:- start:248 stop:394 length:147 start_codon:yes stop_codon:yes gene_type:complete
MNFFDFLRYLIKKKKIYLIPFFLALVLFGFFVVASQSPAIAPFLYAIF